MPLVRLYRYRHLFKASKPEWQDVLPDTPEGRDAYRIAAKYQHSFVRTFTNLVRNTLPEKMPDEFREAWKSNSVSQIAQTLPEPDLESFTEKLTNDYAKVIQEAGDDSTTEMNKKFKTNIEFTIDKAKRIIPVNPFSIEWMKQRSLNLIKEGITKPQHDVIRETLETSFARGMRAEETYNTIRQNIGLTSRDNKAVERRRLLHEEAGLPISKIDSLTNTYRNDLLKTRAQRIARTETIAAQAQGRLASWKGAQESGQLPEAVERTWLAPPASPNPNRPCDICLDLDGRTAKLGEPYEGAFGSFESPPAHPDCRCAESLQKAGTTPKKPLEFVPRERPPARVLTHKPTIGKPKRKPPALPKPREFIGQPRTGKRVQLSAQQQSVDQSARFLAKSEARFDKATSKQRQDFLQWNWVHGSNRKFSVRMKEAAKREFGLKGQIRNPRKFRFTSKQVSDVKNDLRKTYRTTQQDFKARGIEKVRLYRGVRSDISTPGALESWTSDPNVARKFGTNVLVEDVPVKKILNYRGSRSWVDGIWGDQKEYIVMS